MSDIHSKITLTQISGDLQNGKGQRLDFPKPFLTTAHFRLPPRLALTSLWQAAKSQLTHRAKNAAWALSFVNAKIRSNLTFQDVIYLRTRYLDEPTREEVTKHHTFWQANARRVNAVLRALSYNPSKRRVDLEPSL